MLHDPLKDGDCRSGQNRECVIQHLKDDNAFYVLNLRRCVAAGTLHSDVRNANAEANDGGVQMENWRDPFNEPSCEDAAAGNGSADKAVPGGRSPLRADADANGTRRSYGGHKVLKGAAGQAAPSDKPVHNDRNPQPNAPQNHSRDGITAILDEVELKRRMQHNSQPDTGYPSHGSRPAAVPSHARNEVPVTRQPQRTDRPQNGAQHAVQHTAVQNHAARPADTPQPKSGKKKRKSNTAVDILKYFIPWRGDTAFEATRKIIFSTAIVVVGICSFLISDYYIDRYKAKKYYEGIQAMIEETRKNRGFSGNNMVEDPQTGEMIEWLEYNDIANRLLSMNPDLVGYVRIDGTEVSYPVVQKKELSDPDLNPNDYYLYRTFKQESSKSGCIFMDYRNRFDEVVEHRRIVDNSGNVFIYGHNMNNRTMFGSLRDYVNNPSFYSAHPIVDYSSLYKDYKFKIFAIFIVDGADYTSEYAFDCWNTLDFADEDAFYDYVNEAKKRTMINTNVDVKYGDQLLSLYTCNGLCANAKLILMCREVRAGEDLLEGTENATLNENVLYPSAYYRFGRPVNYDPKKFVPYGPNA